MKPWKIVLLVIILYNAATVGGGLLFFKVDKVRNILFAIWLSPYYGLMWLVNLMRGRYYKRKCYLVRDLRYPEDENLYRIEKGEYERLRRSFGEAFPLEIAAESSRARYYLPMYCKKYEKDKIF